MSRRAPITGSSKHPAQSPPEQAPQAPQAPQTPGLKKSPTIETVAEMARVSAMTVSRVLRGSDKVTEATRLRVEQVMHELGYVHNRLAGALASSRSAQIAVIVPTLRNAVFTEVLAGVASALEGSGYQPVIGIAEYDQDRELELLRSMMAWRPAGVILANIRHRDETTRILAGTEVPVVQVMGLTTDPVDMCVGIDHTAAGQAMAEYLCELGYRRFAYLGTDHSMDLAAGSRLAGFNDVLERRGGVMLAKRTVPELAALSLGRREIVPLLHQAPDVELVYCSNDVVAAGVMMHCLAHGIKVPESLGIAGFGGLEIASMLPIQLTTTKTPLFDVGRQSAEQILARLAGRSVTSISDVGFEMVAGESSTVRR